MKEVKKKITKRNAYGYEAPMKVCAKCFVYNYNAVKVCTNCKESFKRD